jgi:carboxymethylenebutenolidase
MQRVRAGREFSYSVAAQARRAYLAEPAAGFGRGVLVVHEVDGLSEFSRDVCDRLAREGFVALAPDWIGSGAGEPAERARELAEALDPARAVAALDAAVECLLGRDACDGSRVGALGFGWGGPLGCELAGHSRRIGAVASVWGAHPQLHPDVAKLEAACLALCAERDDPAGSAAARALETRLRTGGRRGAVRVVPGVRAGFLDAGRPTAFDAVAAATAWDVLLTFLRAELA